MKIRNLLLLLTLTFISVQAPAEAGLWGRVKGEVQHRRDQVKGAAIETHPYFLQLVAALQVAKRTRVITGNAECRGAIDDTAAGARSVINVSPLIKSIGRDAGYRACNRVF